jgi:hypothetical protein
METLFVRTRAALEGGGRVRESLHETPDIPAFTCFESKLRPPTRRLGAGAEHVHTWSSFKSGRARERGRHAEAANTRKSPPLKHTK